MMLDALIAYLTALHKSYEQQCAEHGEQWRQQAQNDPREVPKEKPKRPKKPKMINVRLTTAT